MTGASDCGEDEIFILERTPQEVLKVLQPSCHMRVAVDFGMLWVRRDHVVLRCEVNRISYHLQQRECSICTVVRILVGLSKGERKLYIRMARPRCLACSDVLDLQVNEFVVADKRKIGFGEHADIKTNADLPGPQCESRRHEGLEVQPLGFRHGLLDVLGVEIIHDDFKILRQHW